MKLIPAYASSRSDEVVGYLDLEDLRRANPVRADVASIPRWDTTAIGRMQERWDSKTSPSAALVGARALGKSYAYKKYPSFEFRMDPPIQQDVAVVSFPGQPEKIALSSGQWSYWVQARRNPINCRVVLSLSSGGSTVISPTGYAVARIATWEAGTCDLPAGRYFVPAWLQIAIGPLLPSVFGYEARTWEVTYWQGTGTFRVSTGKDVYFYDGSTYSDRTVTVGSRFAYAGAINLTLDDWYYWLPLGLEVTRKLELGETLFSISWQMVSGAIVGYWYEWVDPPGEWQRRQLAQQGSIDFNLWIGLAWMLKSDWSEATRNR